MDGIFVVDKPDGLTSHDVVLKVRERFGVKAGHAGTLDPHATGVLIIVVGRATKISRFLMEFGKEYLFTIQLGIETNTHDRWGELLRTTSPQGISLKDILDVTSRFRGRYQQIAPEISAIKHRGTPLYKLARSGRNVPTKTKVVRIHKLEVIDYYHPFVTMRLVC